MKTAFTTRCEILSELWLNYKEDPNFTDFLAYNDLGLPLAYSFAEGIVETTELGIRFVNETFDLLLAGLGLEDEGFENLDDILGDAEENNE